jgi:hypothetical protein
MAGVEDLERQVSTQWRRVLTADGLSAHSDDMIAPFAA